MKRNKKSNKILLLFDTNIFYDTTENCTKFDFGNIYDRVKEYIKINKYDQFKIVIPRIVIEELTKHKIENFNLKNDFIECKSKEKGSEKFYECIRQLGYECKIIKNNYTNEKEYRNYIRKIRDEYLNNVKENFEIAEFSNVVSMNTIVRRAINKEKPFFNGYSSKKEFSDAGFKDAVFIESIKKYLQSQNCDYIVFTNDQYILEMNINKIISNRNGEIKDIVDGDTIVRYLNDKYDLKDYSELIKLINDEYFDNTVKEAINCEILEKTHELIEDKDECDNVLYGINLKILKNNTEMKIIVYIDENKNFIKIYDEENQELIFSW